MIRRPAGDALPDSVAVMPLTGVLLLPRGKLPLNIFEPRYLNLVEDALGAGRWMAMIQPRRPQPDPIAEAAELYATGCLGRIDAFAATEDGRYLITLTGVSRFRSTSEAEGRAGYRRLRVDYGPFAGDRGEPTTPLAARPGLLAAARAFFQAKGIRVDWRALDAISDDSLVTLLAMSCPFEPQEKQALLESADLAERGRLITSLMEMAVRQDQGPPPTPQ